MNRDEIVLSNQQWSDVTMEHYLEIDGKKVDIFIADQNYEGSSRHTENHSIVFCIEDTGKYYKLQYETSVKDSMGWEECNHGSTKAVEVFPEVVTTTIFT